MEEKRKQKDVDTMKRGRTEGLKERPDSVTGDTTWDHGGVLACAATKGDMWVHTPAGTGVCYYQG